MHVALSGFFWNRPHVGSGQYLHQLVSQLPHVAGVERLTLLYPALGDSGPPLSPAIAGLPVATPFDRRAAAGGRQSKLATNLAKLWFEQVSLPLLAAGIRADLLHIPYFAPPLRCRIPVVATVHDLVPLLLPEYRGGRLVQSYMRMVSAAARRAASILADSEQSRRDIIAHLKIDPARVTTVYLAAAERYATPPDSAAVKATLARLGIMPPFVYYVGGFDARKNLAVLLHAWALVQPLFPDATLVLAGRLPIPDGVLFPDLRGQIASLGLQASTLLPGFVSDDDNHALYAACSAFVFPSRYEGFGLPPLEAMACGAPVVCADASSLPEVVGDAAQLVPPADVQAWATALDRALSDPALRARARIEGPQRAARFRKRRMAEQTVAVYQQLLTSTG